MKNSRLKRWFTSPSRLLFLAMILVITLGFMGVLPLEKDCAKLGWPPGCNSPHEPPTTLGTIIIWSPLILLLTALMESKYKVYKSKGKGYIGLIIGFLIFAAILGGLYLAIILGSHH